MFRTLNEGLKGFKANLMYGNHTHKLSPRTVYGGRENPENGRMVRNGDLITYCVKTQQQNRESYIERVVYQQHIYWSRTSVLLYRGWARVRTKFVGPHVRTINGAPQCDKQGSKWIWDKYSFFT